MIEFTFCMWPLDHFWCLLYIHSLIYCCTTYPYQFPQSQDMHWWMLINLLFANLGLWCFLMLSHLFCMLGLRQLDSHWLSDILSIRAISCTLPRKCMAFAFHKNSFVLFLGLYRLWKKCILVSQKTFSYYFDSCPFKIYFNLHCLLCANSYQRTQITKLRKIYMHTWNRQRNDDLCVCYAINISVKLFDHIFIVQNKYWYKLQCDSPIYVNHHLISINICSFGLIDEAYGIIDTSGFREVPIF